MILLHCVSQNYSKFLLFFPFTRFLNKECWCKANLHIFKTSLLLVCHLYAGRIICREQTIGKQVFLPAVSRRLNSGLTFLYSFIYSARLAALSLHCIICCLQWERDSLIWNQTASLFGTRFQAQVNLNTVGNSIRTGRQFYQEHTVCA